MEVTPEPPQDPRPSWGLPGLLIAAAALALYAVVLAWNMGACAGGSDASGYFNHARLLGEARLHVPARTLAVLIPTPEESYLYVPLGMKPAPDGDGLVPTYASGLPLLILAAQAFAGWTHAADWTLGIHAVLGVLLTYAAGRKFGLSVRWSALAAAVLATSPLYLFMSLQAMSDVPALVWSTAAVLAAWNARERPCWAGAAGFAVGIAVLIRPNNVLLAAPLALALGLSPRRWLWLAAGALPAAAFFCAHSHAAYGSFLATGYGDTRSSFDTALAGLTLRHYALWLPRLLTPIAVLALGLPWIAFTERRAAAVLGAWAFVYLAFFAIYFNTHETWWYLRFLLPAAPALVVGGLKVARGIAVRWTRCAPRLAWAAALALTLVSAVHWTRKLDALSIGRGELKYARTADWVQAHLPANAVLAVMEVSGAMFYYTPVTFVRWDQIEAGDFGRIASAARSAGRPIYAVLFPFETGVALNERMPGRWAKVGSVDDVTVWLWNGP